MCVLVVIENLDRCYDCYTNGDVSYKHYCTFSLTSALDGVEGSTPRLGRFNPGKDMVFIA